MCGRRPWVATKYAMNCRMASSNCALRSRSSSIGQKYVGSPSSAGT